jgi:hypothetical protein
MLPASAPIGVGDGTVAKYVCLLGVYPACITFMTWFLFGRRDRAMVRRRCPGARGVWMCGWIGILPYAVTSLT